MHLDELTAVSPLDGRYRHHSVRLAPCVSEFAFFRYRLLVEVEYLLALSALGLPQLPPLPEALQAALRALWQDFDLTQAQAIKRIERETNHDVKALEYYLRQQLTELLGRYGRPASQLEFVHFGLTSQDVNNTAMPLMLRRALLQIWLPELVETEATLRQMAETWAAVPMLARTHGQAASPTTFGKELAVFAARLQSTLGQLLSLSLPAKFGGATGNLNAHRTAYPAIDWPGFADAFVEQTLNQALEADMARAHAQASPAEQARAAALWARIPEADALLPLSRTRLTTQIDPYDGLAAAFDGLRRVNLVLVDLCRDIWQYISLDYLRQIPVAGEVGSSAMPHKVNPIDFENAEGNLLLANAQLDFLSNKLPVSRLQRDLSDSTVLRNFGVPLAHTLLALSSIRRGLARVDLNPARLQADLDANWAVLAEAVQTILRREGYPHPYEALKQLTRTGRAIDAEQLAAFYRTLSLSPAVEAELLALRPETYTGYAAELAATLD